jgi:hypothetical protein
MSSCGGLMATVIMLVSHQPIDILVIFFLMQNYFLKYMVTPSPFTNMRLSLCLQTKKSLFSGDIKL